MNQIKCKCGVKVDFKQTMTIGKQNFCRDCAQFIIKNKVWRQNKSLKGLQEHVLRYTMNDEGLQSTRDRVDNLIKGLMSV